MSEERQEATPDLFPPVAAPEHGEEHAQGKRPVASDRLDAVVLNEV